MIWPTVDAISQQVQLPDGYRYQPLRRSDVPALIAAISTWYPDISVGAASSYLESDFYETTATLDGEVERDLWIVLIRYGQELAGFGSWDRERAAQTLYARFGVVSPNHRDAKLAIRLVQFGEATARVMGAGFIYAMATLKSPYMQQALERAGYRLLGFAPGYDRELVAPGVVKRVYEAYYAKVLVSEDELLQPDTSNMTPKTKELFELLFPETTRGDA
ncbi:MAG: hypothetical protein WBO95_12305 [Candidatus Dechloromonas phosphoritropha]|jgi:hypothetical protein